MKKITIILGILSLMPFGTAIGWTIYFNNLTDKPATFNAFKVFGDRTVKDFTVPASAEYSYSVGGWCTTKIQAWPGEGTAGYDANIVSYAPVSIGACSDIQVTYYDKGDGTRGLVIRDWTNKVSKAFEDAAKAVAYGVTYVTDKVKEYLIDKPREMSHSVAKTIQEMANTLANIPNLIQEPATEFLGSATKKSMSQQITDAAVDLDQQIKTIREKIAMVKQQKIDIKNYKLDEQGLLELQTDIIGDGTTLGALDYVLAALNDLANENAPTGALLEIQKTLNENAALTAQEQEKLKTNINQIDRMINHPTLAEDGVVEALPTRLKNVASMLNL